jgi:hypothetical protein
MDAHPSQTQRSFGFASIRERMPHGYFGGYLVINELARPLEFHCTLPLLPTKAQQILFGATLDEFVCGEQIARAMLSKAKVKPSMVLTDCPAALSVRHWIDVPVFYLHRDGSDDGSGDDGFRIPRQQRPESETLSRSIGEYEFRWLQSYANDGRALQWLEGADSIPVDLREPFGRIVEALAEAHPRPRVA